MSDTPEQPGQVPADQPTAGQVPAVSASELAEARKEAANYRVQLRKLQEAQEAAQREAQERQGEYQKLYESEKQRAEGLATAAQRAEALEAVLSTHVKEAARELPEELRALLPETTPEQQLAWLNQAKKAAAKLAQQQPAGTPSGPRNLGSTAAATIDLVERKRQSGMY